MKIVLLTAYCFLLTTYCFAQEIPVDVKADQLKFYEDSALVEASGSVEVKFKEVTIQADHLRMDSKTNVATAEGNVRLVAKEYRSASEKLTYDANRNFSTFTNFRSELHPKNIRGALYVNAKEVKDTRKVMRGGPGEVNTCGLLSPHYHLTASRIEYYPDDRIEGVNAVLYMGEMPVLWLPYIRYEMHRRRRENWTLGHNDVEGDFFKSSWAYPAGLLLLDYMEKKGLGLGTEVGYGLGALGLGTLYVYHLNEKDTGTEDWVTRINHERQITPATKLKLNHRYTSTYLVPNGRLEQTALGLNLNYADKNRGDLRFDALDDRIGLFQRYALQFNYAGSRSNLGYYYNYDFAKSDPKWMRKSQRLNYRQPLWGSVSLNTTANYYHSVAREGDSGEERVEPQVEITGSGPGYSWRATENWFVDLRQDLSPGVPRYEFMEKQPEIEIYPRALDLKLFSLQSTLGYGYYREVKYVPELGRKRDFGTQRCRAALNAGRTIPVGMGTALVLGAGLDQLLYAPGDQLYAFRENASLQTNLFSFFRNNLDFRQGYTEGNTPFFFDRLGTRYHDIRERMNFYYLDKFNWTIDGGHNWLTNKYFDVMTNLMLSPDRRLRLNISTGWDIENTKYKDLVASLRLAPWSFFSADFSAVQDMNVGELRSGNVLYDIYFLEKQSNQMHLRLGQVFDPGSKEFKVRDIMVVKDLHCWEMKYTYSDYRKEFSLVFTLKALPEEPLGFATGRGFYFEGFQEAEREIKGLKMEGEIRRY